jgi:hypothetical protein
MEMFGALSYLFIVGEIKRMELKTEGPGKGGTLVGVSV